MALENAKTELRQETPRPTYDDRWAVDDRWAELRQETPRPTYDDIMQQLQQDPVEHQEIQRLSINQQAPENVEQSTSAKKPTVATLNLTVQEWKDKTANDMRIAQNIMQELLQKQRVMEQWMRSQEERDQTQVQLKFRISYLERRIGEF